MDATTTAYLFTILGLLLNATALGVSWRLARPMPGTRDWFVGAAISAVAVVPLLLSLLYPYPPLLSLHNAGVALGGAFVVAGVYRFFGLRPPWRVMLALIAAFMAVHSWFLYRDYDMVARTAAASLTLAALYLLGTWRLTVAPWRGARLARIYAAAGWWALTLAMALRAALAFAGIGTGSANVPAMEANITYLLAFIAAPITSTAALLGLIMMTVRRLADEREQALAEARVATEHYRELATYDWLTGAYNRRPFMDRAGEQLSLCRRSGQPFSLLLIDLDRFKLINDSYGHAGGDAALRHTAQCVRKELRDYDVFGRLGGEEFAVALAGAGPAQAMQVSDRLRAAIAAGTICHEAHSFGITMSGGVVTARDGDSIDALLSAADVALYRAKNGGRNRVEAADATAA